MKALWKVTILKELKLDWRPQLSAKSIPKTNNTAILSYWDDCILTQ